MLKSFLVGNLLCFIMVIEGFSQPSTESTISNYTYHPPSTDKLSWQRLNLQLTTDFYRGIKQSKVGSDSSLIYISKILGISRLVIAAEGIDDPELIMQSDWFDNRNPGKGIRLLSQMKGKKHLEQMILLGAYYTFQPGSHKRYRDSIEYFLKPSLTESKNLDEKKLGRVALCLLGKVYAMAADTVNAGAVFNQLFRECREAGDKAMEARTYAYRGLYTAYRPYNLQSKQDDLEKALQICREIKDTEREIYLLSNDASFYMLQNKLDDAHTAFIQAVELEKSIGFPYMHHSDDDVAMLTMIQDKFGEPLQYTLESIKVAEATRDTFKIQEFYLRLGQLYYAEGGRNEESLKWMLKALDRYVADNDGKIYSTLLNVVSLMNETKGSENKALDLLFNIAKKNPPLVTDDQIFYNMSLASCYTSLKQYNLAAQYIAAADSIQTRYPALSIAGSYQKDAILDLSNSINFARGEYKKVKQFLEASLADSSRLTVLSDDLQKYQRLIFIDSVFGDAASGVKHYKEYTALLDSNFRVSKIRQAEELQVIYQTQQQKDQIALLNQQATLEQANLKQATKAKNLTIAGIIAVLIIAGLLFWQNRLRKKNNEMITQKNELLEHLLTEKEWLLKEIHHRVKNNLQIVMSLLNSQSAYIENDAALTAIHDSQHRVHAISLIHQKLYNAENVSSINMSSYILELVSYLSDGFNVGQRIQFKCNIAPLELDVSQAIPLGLILNEAITNSIKYAFPNEREGLISVSLLNTDGNHYLLTIADNGIGLPGHFANKKAGSLGMNLITGLTEDLEGTFAIENNNGTIVKISFVHDHIVKWSDIQVPSFVTIN